MTNTTDAHAARDALSDLDAVRASNEVAADLHAPPAPPAPKMISIADAKARVMRAARHLNKSRMAWVANRMSSGIDWCGCAKGHIADQLVRGATHPGRDWRACEAKTEVEESWVQTIESRMRCQEGADGDRALRQCDAPEIERQIRVQEKIIEEWRDIMIAACKEYGRLARKFGRDHAKAKSARWSIEMRRSNQRSRTRDALRKIAALREELANAPE